MTTLTGSTRDRSTYHRQLANMSYDEILDLLSFSFFFFFVKTFLDFPFYSLSNVASQAWHGRERGASGIDRQYRMLQRR